ncbi:hypothetical protein [Yinghuangia sp. YIM S10712]|uniref:hypothetical protein n=1 Tax=Yinghuangia sp. YIM S10712 TaxID=3436930 RepID=UPI003F52D67B
MASKPDDIRATYRRHLDSIRGARNVHPDAKKVEVARAYHQARTALDRARKEQQAQDEKIWPDLERRLFGYDTGYAAPAERAATVIAARDAYDRAANLGSSKDAAQLLARAEQTGDELLARAVAQRANDRSWNEVLGDYLSRRPEATRIYNQMCEIYQRRTSLNGNIKTGMDHALHRPEELTGLSDTDIAALAGDVTPGGQ